MLECKGAIVITLPEIGEVVAAHTLYGLIQVGDECLPRHVREVLLGVHCLDGVYRSFLFARGSAVCEYDVAGRGLCSKLSKKLQAALADY